ncbi:SDR family oxidoreductase [Methylobacterium organophilum]|uniref:SDR family oxidoreductase n=1 Tax=Methylobacterium organophilum TaxID=410 RepID=UPI001F13E57D|nr:SDR family oxidoreductase [Methylobacterium organophilum]UMY17731.1 SDR family oxidoreductase [Methylobacterium organophilum]
MRGRTCLVTGASSGIGAETALGLARLGARVGVVGRDRGRTEAIAERIRRETGAEADVFVADLAAQAQVRRLAGEVQARYECLHVLVNNAGAIFSERRLTEDGLERTWALDHLAYVLLTLELLDLLKRSAPSRIVNLASEAHRRGVIDLDDLGGERAYGAMKNYSQAKLGNVLFTYALARRLAGSGVTVNALHPGVVASRFASEAGGLFGFGWRLIKPLMITPVEGARNSLRAASAPELEGVSGRYFTRRGEQRSSRTSRDEALQERVWELSLKQIGLA